MAKATDKTAASKAVAAKCKNLETELSVLNRNIRNHPDNDKLYYSKGVALKKLAEITGSKEKCAEALASFNEAVGLDSENPHYLIKRAELLVIMNRNQEAFRDLQAASGLAGDILAKPLGDLSIEEMAAVNAIRDVAKLDAMHRSIDALVAGGKLDEGMKNLFTDHIIGSIKDIMMQTPGDSSLHDQLVKMLHDRLSGIQHQIKANGELSAVQIAAVKTELSQQAGKLEILQRRFVEIESTTRSLSKKVDENQAMNDRDRIQAKESVEKINAALKNLNSKVEAHDPILGNITAELNELMNNKDLTLSSIEDLHQRIDEVNDRLGKVEAATGALNKKIDENTILGEQAKIEAKQTIEKINASLKSLHSKVEAHDPILKNMVESVNELLAHKDISLENINDLWQKIEGQDQRIEQNAVAIAKMREEAMGQLGRVDKQVQEYFAKAAVGEGERLEARAAIQSIEKTIKNLTGKVNTANTEDQRIPVIIEELSKLSSSNENNVSRILTLSKKIRAMESQERKMPQEEKSANLQQSQTPVKAPLSSEIKLEKKDNDKGDDKDSDMFGLKKGEGTMETKAEEPKDRDDGSVDADKLGVTLATKEQTEVTQVHCVREIIYDNELLNHPEIFNKLANIYGANKVLDLSSQMSPLALHEAIEGGNLELLGSILSLD